MLITFLVPGPPPALQPPTAGLPPSAGGAEGRAAGAWLFSGGGAAERGEAFGSAEANVRNVVDCM